jgi:tripartite-type tricarboxylate transporter receptor subunit TctC
MNAPTGRAGRITRRRPARMPAAIKHSILAACVAAVASLALPAKAQEFPAKPVRIIVPYTQGGAADLTARVVGEKLAELWKQQALVENRGGGNGVIGVEAVMRAPADGYTLLMLASGTVVNVAVYPKPTYDLARDFVPVLMATATPMVLAAHPRVPAATLRELVAELRAKPGRYDIASCGVATSHHFAVEMFKHATKTFAVHIPHRGCAGATTDAVAGQLDLVLTSLPAALPFVKQGKLKAIAITPKDRSPIAPDVPTFRESGLPELADFNLDIYYGFMAPAGTPREVLAKLEGDVRRVMALPEVRTRLAGAGLDPYVLGPADMAKVLRDDVEKYRRAVKVANIRPE